jgi:anti-sigma-K factor RskA
MNTTRLQSEDDDLRLAEYALGVLDADERKAVETQVATRHEYAQRLAEWDTHLSPMLEELADAAPPEYVWARIRDSLGHSAPVELVGRSESAGGMWDSLALWRWFSVGGLAATVFMAVMLVVTRPGDSDLQPADSMLSAALQLETGQTVYTATLDASRRNLIVTPAAEIQLEGREAQLWLIAGDLPPQSLGLLPADRAVRLAVPEDLRLLADANSVFAISLEPPGGSPTGLPTGPVVAQGLLADI